MDRLVCSSPKSPSLEVTVHLNDSEKKCVKAIKSKDLYNSQNGYYDGPAKNVLLKMNLKLYQSRALLSAGPENDLYV